MKQLSPFGMFALIFLSHCVICSGRDISGLSVTRQDDLKLWYDQPATDWQTQALPIGNGRLAAMIFGGIHEEHIQFNEESLWIGDEYETGAYQPLGDVFVKFDQTNAIHYRRELDLARAVHTVTYESDGVTYRREAYASFPANVLVFQFTADKSGSLTGAVSLTDMHKGTITVKKNKLICTGSLAGCIYHGGSAKRDQPPYAVALGYEAQVAVCNDGGSVAVRDGKINFKNVNQLTLFLDGGTDFLQDSSKGWRGEPPHAAIQSRLNAALHEPYGKLLARHVADYQQLFGRVGLNVGETKESVRSLPTDRRLMNYRLAGGNDPELEALLFQYGRYLLIASSRSGGLPANLQGKWNNQLQPPWRCDYHTDINLEMNYWLADEGNLSECFEPYARWINSIRPVRTAATRQAFGVRGWTMRGESGLFGGSTWDWLLGSSAWLLQNSYDHYRFTGDRVYLRQFAYPAMKEVSEFWIDNLKAQADGQLTTPVDLSPEHSPKAPGISFDLEWVWDLFTSTIEASRILGVDAPFRAELADKLARLAPLQIGKWGQLQEWSTDRDDPKDHHRHLSHLVGLYPGREISPLTTPQLATAAKVSLNARGDDGEGGPGWGRIWRICCWARLCDGDRAHDLVQKWIRGNVSPNLFDTVGENTPLFQIDGNFGYPAGVCEMLLQSQNGEIIILPALPKAWPSGNVTGLRARGGLEVDLSWADGKLIATTIRSIWASKCVIHYGSKAASFDLLPGQAQHWDGK